MRRLLSAASLLTALSQPAPDSTLSEALPPAPVDPISRISSHAWPDSSSDAFMLLRGPGYSTNITKYDRHPEFISSERLEARVNFWVRIFTTSEKNVSIINAWYPWVEYSTLSFPDSLPGMTPMQFERYRKQSVDAKKRNVYKALRHLASGAQPESELELRIASAFSSFPDSAGALKHAASDMKMVRAQKGAHERFAIFLARSGRYLPEMEQIWERVCDHPRELLEVPMIESGFNPWARSKQDAVGPWQFLRATAVIFGLKVNAQVDQRQDPFLSTEAAAKYLADAHSKLGNWPLATSSYNGGIGGYLSYSRRANSQKLEDVIDYAAMSGLPSYKFDSSNYFAKLLAWLQVKDNLAHYFPEVEVMPPLKYRVMELPNGYSARMLSNLLGVSTEELREYNPSLRDAVWKGRYNIPAGFKFRVPSHVPEARYSALLQFE